MNFFSFLTSNYVINVGFVAWMSAQVIKTILVFFATKQFIPERLVGSGGMPSSHSALVCSITVAIAKVSGFQSPLFALSLAFAVIIMYDAMGVRRAAGEHAKALNKVFLDLRGLGNVLDSLEDELEDELDRDLVPDADKSEPALTGQQKLKEYLGHTPLEVLGGALLGILIGSLMTPPAV